MIESFWIYPLIFSLTITIHNIEEALWLPKWSKEAGKYYKPVGSKTFHFTATIITLLAYLFSTIVIFIGFDTIIGGLLIGFMGAMFLNAVFPHLVMTIIMRRYAPGVITGMVINLPILGIILKRLVETNVISIVSLLWNTVLMSVLLLIMIRLLFFIGKRLFEYGHG